VQTVGCHQLYVVFRARLDDVMAFFLGGGQWLLAENVDAGLSRPNTVVLVQIIWQGDVNRVDLTAPETQIVVVVTETVFDPILPGHRAQFHRIVGDDGGKFGVGFSMSEGRQNGVLRNVTEPHDCIAYFSPFAAQTAGRLNSLEAIFHFRMDLEW